MSNNNGNKITKTQNKNNEFYLNLKNKESQYNTEKDLFKEVKYKNLISDRILNIIGKVKLELIQQQGQ